MFAASSYVAAFLASCVIAVPQHYVYVPQGPPQHYGVVSPNYNTRVATALNPVAYNPVGQGYSPGGYNPMIGYNPAYNPTQQFYYNGYPQQPPFVFYYPHQGVIPQAPPQTPIAPPIDETGDSETISVTGVAGVTPSPPPPRPDEEDSSEREPLSPGVAISGAETGKRVGMPEKHVQSPASPIYRIMQQPGMLTKAAVQKRPEPLHQEYKRVALKQQLEEVEAPRHTIQSRMGSPAESEIRAAAENEGRNLRVESRGWRRRLAPNYQSVYLEADDEQDDDKKKPGKVEADSVVVSNSDGPAGPSVASVKPAAIALAGPGGVASASPVGTAVVGPGGLAVAAPSATAVAGPSSGVPPGALGTGSASARSNLRLHQILESLYAKPARQAVLRVAPSALSYDDDYE